MATLYISKTVGNVVHVASTAHQHSACGDTQRDPGLGRLILRRGGRGTFHELCGIRVDHGDFLELVRSESSSLVGRYDWSHCQQERPALIVDGIAIEIAPTDTLRWPSKQLMGGDAA